MSALVTVITTGVAGGGLAIAAASYHLNRRNTKNNEQVWRKSEDTFKRARKKLKSAMSELQQLAQDAQVDHLLISGVPLLVKHGWIPSHPSELEQITLNWRESGKDEEKVRRELDPAREQTRRYWPRASEVRDTYHDVIERLESPNRDLFFDGSSYRLLEVDINEWKTVLTFGPGRYFDHLDTSDVLGYESALLALGTSDRIHGLHRSDTMSGRYRRWLGNPFDLSRRCGIPGVSTLTIRRGQPAPTFVLHQRDGNRVALAQGVTHVTPAGEFQPKNLSVFATATDLNLWNNIVREYAEEFLGIEPARGQPLTESADDQLRRVTRSLNDARTAGKIVARYLGIGLDPLTWKPEILTVAIFDAETFDEIFAQMVSENDEGQLIFADSRTRAGIPFTEDNVESRARGRMLTSGQACLRLAWKHRAELGIRE